MADIVDQLLYLGRSTGELIGELVDRDADHAERRADLVTDAGGERTRGGHAVAHHELVVERAPDRRGLAERAVRLLELDGAPDKGFSYSM